MIFLLKCGTSTHKKRDKEISLLNTDMHISCMVRKKKISPQKKYLSMFPFKLCVHHFDHFVPHHSNW
jgi:hypothetical protein